MNKRTVLIVVLGLAALLPHDALAQATVTPFTATEDQCVVLYPGAWTFADGNIQIRGLLLKCQETSSTALYGGENLIVVNANLRAVEGAFLGGIGPIWGTFQMENWAGTWEGKSGSSGVTYNAQGQGSGDRVGMKVWISTNNGQASGRILDPQGT